MRTLGTGERVAALYIMGQYCRKGAAEETECPDDSAPQGDASLSTASETSWFWDTPPMTTAQRRMTVSTRSLTEEALVKIVHDPSRTPEVRAYAQAELDRR